MMIYRAFLKSLPLLFITIYADSLIAATHPAVRPENTAITAAEVKKGVQSYVTKSYIEKVGQNEFEDSLQITVSNLDKRLRLSSCAVPLDYREINKSTRGHHITVKVSCRKDKPWSIHVPVKIDRFEDIVVLSRSVQRGQLLSESDLSYEKFNTSLQGYGVVKDVERLVGMELRRNLKPGDPVKLSHVRAPHVIKKGEPVVLEASASSFSVEAPGLAMSDGELGQQIRVKNTDSKRIVNALVVAPGRVKVPLR